MLRPMRSLARLTGGEPKLALGATYLVGAMCVLIGSLNAVAPLLSMCFLTCYSMMNLNCCLLGLLKANPDPDPNPNPNPNPNSNPTCCLLGLLKDPS